MIRRYDLLAAALTLGSLSLLAACESKPPTPPPAPTPAPAPAPAPAKPTGTTAADKHDDHAGHDHAAGDKHDDHGPAVELGTSTIGPFQVKASRDGDVVPGDDAPVDLWITAAADATAKVSTVRAWFGTQDAKGSVKAKMELEKDNYHSHIEIPKPLPAGSKLWVEIEDAKGGKSTGSFDIKNG